MKIFLKMAALVVCTHFLSACISSAASAEEYYSLGMAYYELGKYEEAEKWLNRATYSNKTVVASQYNLGRLAFERQRYDDAAKYFEDILKKDQNNVLALKAAAYTRIKTGDIDIAEKHYSNLLEMVPESADDGYNHALVLYAMGRYSEAESVLDKYRLSLLGKSEVQLLHARSQAAQNKVEAIDSLSSWLNSNKDAQVRYEYALVLESHEYYARAMEEYRKALTETASSEKTLNNNIRFALARTLLIADNASNDGITELQTAVKDGFNDIEAVEELLKKEKISSANKRTIENIVNNMKNELLPPQEETKDESS
jgi:tetratricopeptide (TPR) repeat protein